MKPGDVFILKTGYSDDDGKIGMVLSYSHDGYWRTILINLERHFYKECHFKVI